MILTGHDAIEYAERYELPLRLGAVQTARHHVERYDIDAADARLIVDDDPELIYVETCDRERLATQRRAAATDHEGDL